MKDDDLSGHRKLAASKRLQNLGSLHPSEVEVDLILNAFWEVIPGIKLFRNVIDYDLPEGSAKSINHLKTSVWNGTQIKTSCHLSATIKINELMEWLKLLIIDREYWNKREMHEDRYNRLHSTLCKEEKGELKCCYVSSSFRVRMYLYLSSSTGLQIVQTDLWVGRFKKAFSMNRWIRIRCPTQGWPSYWERLGEQSTGQISVPNHPLSQQL